MNTWPFRNWFARYPNSGQCEQIANAAWDAACEMKHQQIQQLVDACFNLQNYLESLEVAQTGFDIPDEIYGPFVHCLEDWTPDIERIKTIDGKDYHCDSDGKLLTYEDGSYVPASICICAAHSSSECCCGAWDIPLDAAHYT